MVLEGSGWVVSSVVQAQTQLEFRRGLVPPPNATLTRLQAGELYKRWQSPVNALSRLPVVWIPRLFVTSRAHTHDSAHKLTVAGSFFPGNSRGASRQAISAGFLSRPSPLHGPVHLRGISRRTPRRCRRGNAGTPRRRRTCGEEIRSVLAVAASVAKGLTPRHVLGEEGLRGGYIQVHEKHKWGPHNGNPRRGSHRTTLNYPQLKLCTSTINRPAPCCAVWIKSQHLIDIQTQPSCRGESSKSEKPSCKPHAIRQNPSCIMKARRTSAS